ncbi:immune-associated nucleotide-binding protein 9 [Cryptomeria japonica]|uniref:immune-associated nucleotide-binding protein 9 n=1 Tax=Cryptomeria japonica TaxID=3369 RepID=UPI0025AB7C9D|nr:immune-associated nucleotide-binding protein 9 [Cryptomeria japonica]
MATTTLVLIGRTGNGKSSTANSILGRNAFKAKGGQQSVTELCQQGERKWKEGRTINVIDTPGLFDTKRDRRFVETEIVRCIDLARDGVHAFILVLSIQNRFTEEELNAFEKFQFLFGPKVLDYMTIVFTRGDELEADCLTLEDYLESSVKKLMGRCENRVVVFDNRTKSETKRECQVTKLLETVDKSIADNGGRPYSNELFEKAKELCRTTSQLFSIKGVDYAKTPECQEQVKLLNEMFARKIEESKIEMLTTTKGLQEQLKSMQAQKDTFYEEICSVKKELNEARKKYAKIKEMQDDACCSGCSIV